MRLLISSLFWVVALSVHAERIDIGSGAIELPPGWVVLVDKRDCFVGEIGIKNGFRNTEGTIWILSTVLPPKPMRKFTKDTAQWIILEKGKTSKQEYLIVAKPSSQQSPFIVFPQTRTYFQVILTEKGNADAREMLRWWTPPKGERFKEELEEVKKVLFTSYSPIDSDAATNK